MCWFRLLPLILIAGRAFGAEAWIVGVGAEGDTADGLAASVVADVGLTEETWISTALARNAVELPRGERLDTWYVDLGIDHWFDPVGIRAGAAYWGDRDILDSVDWRASLYARGGRVSIAGDYEYRDFRFVLPATDFFPGQALNFAAQGIGLTSRFELTDTASLSVFGMDYDYDVTLDVDSNRRVLELLSFSRLSLINSLVDYRFGATLGIDVGKRRWQFEAMSWKGEVDNGVTRSATVRYLTPISDTADIEFGIGADDSEFYGTVTFFSIFIFFYG